MKNKYEELMNRIEIKNDQKAFVKEAVLNYEKKPNRKNIFLKTGIAFAVVVLLMIIPNLTGLNQTKIPSFIIKADESLYQIQKEKLILNEIDLKQEYNAGIGIYPKTNEKSSVAVRYNTTIPFGIYVEGEGISSITYDLHHGSFSRLNEVYDPTVQIESGSGTARSKNSTGIFVEKKDQYITVFMSKEYKIKDDSNKTYWELLKEGSQINIPYESQKSINALYTLNPIVLYSDLSEEEKKLLKEDGGYQLASDELLYKALNKMEVDVCVNYKDGTHETTTVKFEVDKSTYRLNFDNKN